MGWVAKAKAGGRCLPLASAVRRKHGPNAEVKIFLDANPQERVRRRLEELRAKGTVVDEGELAALMKERDNRDSTRADAPLSQAPDAVYLDSTPLSLDQVEEAILKIVRARVTNGKDFS